MNEEDLVADAVSAIGGGSNGRDPSKYTSGDTRLMPKRRLSDSWRTAAFEYRYSKTEYLRSVDDTC